MIPPSFGALQFCSLSLSVETSCFNIKISFCFEKKKNLYICHHFWSLVDPLKKCHTCRHYIHMSHDTLLWLCWHTGLPPKQCPVHILQTEWWSEDEIAIAHKSSNLSTILAKVSHFCIFLTLFPTIFPKFDPSHFLPGIFFQSLAFQTTKMDYV